MPTATLTSKGQITIPVSVRNRLDLRPGDQVDFWEDGGSTLRITPRKRSIDDLFGMVRGAAVSLSIEEMDDVMGEAATEAGLV